MSKRIDNFFLTDSSVIGKQKCTVHNSTLAIGGVPSPLDSFVVKQSSILRIKFSAENPAHRQSAKRYKQV